MRVVGCTLSRRGCGLTKTSLDYANTLTCFTCRPRGSTTGLLLERSAVSTAFNAPESGELHFHKRDISFMSNHQTAQFYDSSRKRLNVRLCSPLAISNHKLLFVLEFVQSDVTIPAYKSVQYTSE